MFFDRRAARKTTRTMTPGTGRVPASARSGVRHQAFNRGVSVTNPSCMLKTDVLSTSRLGVNYREPRRLRPSISGLRISMPLRIMDPDALAVSSTELQSRGAYDMTLKSKLHVATFSRAHHFTWWNDHVGHHALVIPDYSNLMCEPRAAR